MTDTNSQFAGSIPAIYDRCLGPFLFEPYARDLARRVSNEPGERVLELAAGTGILTTELRRTLPASAHIVATDLNPDMLAIARPKLAGAPVEWQQADAQALPFSDAGFDTVVCQFGVMFFPDKPAACHEVRRVLKPGGHFVFNVWHDTAHNPFAQIAQDTVRRYFTSDPPTFYDVPFGFANVAAWAMWLAGAGLELVTAEVVPILGEGQSADTIAEGMIAGNPAIIPIRERATATPDVIMREAAAELARRFGAAPCRVPLEAIVFVARAS